MRKLMLAMAIAVLATAVFASTAAAFDHHFSVLAKTKSSHRVGHNAFRFKDRLFEVGNRHNKVGRDRGECRFKQRRHKLKCHAVVHLNGKVGGFGDIRVRGDLSRHDNRVVVLGGSGDFNGVAGKMILHDRGHKPDKLHFDLVR